MVASLLFLLVLSWLVGAVDSGPIEKRDADFASVRTHLDKDFTSRSGPEQKYFHESVYHYHYDGRFASHRLSYDEKKIALPVLLRAFVSTMRDIGAETWIMHGTLLGWWWNSKVNTAATVLESCLFNLTTWPDVQVLPWDTDIDVQVTESTMHYLASYYNMTIHRYADSEFSDKKEFLLEINPNYVNRSRLDQDNIIDARWVDTSTGLFIDITVVARNYSHPIKHTLSCKDGHDYIESSIFPLRDSTFEGVRVKIPYAYVGILSEEYGKRSLVNAQFNGYAFPF
ncbi:MAG: hypothetical protein M1840_008252 [Geoglossum simile]|nr:MAG: hypothetical protein M1840_008252 [Geoglossum simile]